jgi:hypothetical protein
VDFGELYDFIVFMVHSFLRPSEWELLQHKNVRTFTGSCIEKLVISVPTPKTNNAKISIDRTTPKMAACLNRKKMISRHDNKTDFLFYNDIKDRTYASDRASKMFMWLVSRAGVLMLMKLYLTHPSPQMTEFIRQLRAKRVLEISN